MVGAGNGLVGPGHPARGRAIIYLWSLLIVLLDATSERPAR